MEEFQELKKDCIATKDDNILFEENYHKLIACDTIRKLLEKYNDKEFTKACIYTLLKKPNFKSIPPKFKTFKGALREEIKKIKGIKKPDYRIKKNKQNSSLISLDANYEDSNTSLLDTISDGYNLEEDIENKQQREFLQELDKLEIKKNSDDFKILFSIYNFENLPRINDINELLVELNMTQANHMQVKHSLKTYASKSPKIAKMVRNLFSFDTYSEIVKYLINTGNKKVKIPELIINFSKIRNYLSIVMFNNNLKDRASIIEKSNLDSLSSYEKEIHRILSVFKTDKSIFELKEDIKGYSPNKFARIYNIHTVPNLISNFLILDVLNKYKSSNIKLANIIDELFSKEGLNTNSKDIKNFRKYTILPRLKELSEYGLVKINNNQYTLDVRYLNNEQKSILKDVVPFFCGIYPFSSIGHFLANRLDINDRFSFEPFDIRNMLDDCILFDLLEAINNNQLVTLKLLNKNEKTFMPKEIVIDKDSCLRKVSNGKEEYYLKDIDEVNYDKKVKNLVFSEIYSFYYKIIEESIKEYKNKNYNISDILEKYGTSDTSLNEANIKFFLKLLVKLEKVSIPLTKLELQWLKTIMQDCRFDLFVSKEEKTKLEVLIKDIEPFNLSVFKNFDHKKKKYINIQDVSIDEINKEEFSNILKQLNSILYSSINNSFKVI